MRKRDILFKALPFDPSVGGFDFIQGHYLELHGMKCGNKTIAHYIVPNNDISDMVEIIPQTVCQFTGLTDKNGIKGFFGDIWLVKDFEYHEKSNFGGFYTRKTDLKFYLEDKGLKVDYVLIDPPKGLNHITLSVIFNLPIPSGKRMFIDTFRQSLEIIGNIHDNK